MLTEGDEAPDFTVTDTVGRDRTLSEGVTGVPVS